MHHSVHYSSKTNATNNSQRKTRALQQTEIHQTSEYRYETSVKKWH